VRRAHRQAAGRADRDRLEQGTEASSGSSSKSPRAAACSPPGSD
jgi:hypothetical protein